MTSEAHGWLTVNLAVFREWVRGLRQVDADMWREFRRERQPIAIFRKPSILLEDGGTVEGHEEIVLYFHPPSYPQEPRGVGFRNIPDRDDVVIQVSSSSPLGGGLWRRLLDELDGARLYTDAQVEQMMAEHPDHKINRRVARWKPDGRWQQVHLVGKPAVIRAWLDATFAGWSEMDALRKQRPARWCRALINDARIRRKRVVVGTDINGDEVVEYQPRFSLTERKWLLVVAFDVSRGKAVQALRSLRQASGVTVHEGRTAADFPAYAVDPRRPIPQIETQA